VDQHQRQLQALQLLLEAQRRHFIGKLNFHALETGGAGGARALDQRALGEQQRQVGGDSHAPLSRYCSTRVAGSRSAWPWLACRRISCAARPLMGVALPCSRDRRTAVSRSLSNVRTCHLIGSKQLSAICGARIRRGLESAKPPASAGAIREASTPARSASATTSAITRVLQATI